jgi:hypothetical protein
MTNADAGVVDRRSWALSLWLTAALSVGWVAMLSRSTHLFQWSSFQDSVADYVRSRAEDPAAVVGVPAPAPPQVWADVLYSLDLALPLIAAMLLGVALIAAGHRRWALVTPVLLTASVLPAYMTLGETVMLPADVAAATSPWWPWHEATLQTVLATLPVAAATWASRARPSRPARPRVRTQAALARAAVASAIFVLGWVTVSPTELGVGEPVALARAGTFVLLVLTTGLVAAGSSWRLLGVWTATTAVLLGTRVLARSGGLLMQYSSGLALPSFLDVCALALGPLAVLGAPWAGRQWVRIFRSDRAMRHRPKARSAPR